MCERKHLVIKVVFFLVFLTLPVYYVHKKSKKKKNYHRVLGEKNEPGLAFWVEHCRKETSPTDIEPTSRSRGAGLAGGISGCLLGYGGVSGLYCTELLTFLRRISD